MRDAVITTERLTLRRITYDDVNALHALFSDAIAMRYFPAIKTYEECKTWVTRVNEYYIKYGYAPWMVIRKTDNAPLGYCGLIVQENILGRDETEVGYGFIREHWHNGYATEAAYASMAYGFSTLHKERLISLIRPENISSMLVAKRNGMWYEKTVMFAGYAHDVYVQTRDSFLA